MLPVYLASKNIYKSGGAQAIAAMAYGTQTVEKVDKIFGPGNQYVTCAKKLVNVDGVAIDMLRVQVNWQFMQMKLLFLHLLRLIC